MSLHSFYITFNGYDVEIKTNDVNIASEIREQFCFMLVLIPNKIINFIYIHQQEYNYFLYKNGVLIKSENTVNKVVEYVEKTVFISLIDANPQFLFIHAGAVAYSGKAIMITGASCCGKSSFAYQLCEAGWEYLSDEIVAINTNTREMLPIPKAVNFRKSIDAEGFSANQKKNKYFPKKVCRMPISIGTIVFPFFTLNIKTRLNKYLLSIAASELISNCLNVYVHKGFAFQYLCDLIQSTPIYRIHYSKVEQAVELLLKEIQKSNE